MLKRHPAGKPVPKPPKPGRFPRTNLVRANVSQQGQTLVAHAVNIYTPKPVTNAAIAASQTNDVLVAYAQTHMPIIARIDFIELGIHPITVPSTPDKPIFEVYFAELSLR